VNRVANSRSLVVVIILAVVVGLCFAVWTFVPRFTPKDTQLYVLILRSRIIRLLLDAGVVAPSYCAWVTM